MPERENGDLNESPKRRIRLTVAYEGTDYLGWQYQPNGPTVQGALESALSEVLSESIRVTGAGRTDAGVHALGQVAHFDTDSRLASEVIERALNARLPRDIRVRKVKETGSDFHARYSASAKFYRYCLADPCLPESVLLRRTHWIRSTEFSRPELLQECAVLLAGEHDFFTFSRSESHRKHHLCEVFRADWVVDEGKLAFEIEANRFLRRMVRMLLGAILAVAEERTGLEDFRRALEVPGRMPLAVPAPAAGLTLVRVEYPASPSKP